jgi:putative phosphoesterase
VSDSNGTEFRVAVFADTHGNIQALKDALKKNGPFDLVVHLGDGVEDGARAAEEMGLAFHGVAGNEDFRTGFPETFVLKLGRFDFLLIHGHQTDINPFQPKDIWDVYFDELCDWARNRGATGLMFGHTHKTYLDRTNDLVILNPGEQHPGSGWPPTFAVVELVNGEIGIEIRTSDENGSWTATNRMVV